MYPRTDLQKAIKDLLPQVEARACERKTRSSPSDRDLEGLEYFLLAFLNGRIQRKSQYPELVFERVLHRLSPRTRNVLKDRITLDWLLSSSEEQVLRLGGMGEAGLRELKEALAEHDLELGTTSSVG